MKIVKVTTTSQEEIPKDDEMEDLMRSTDWSKTPLGPSDKWPQSLKVAVNICQNSLFPAIVMWGKEFVMIYNSAYEPVLGKKHPWSLGKTLQEVWPELQSVNKPLVERVLYAGDTVLLEDMLLNLYRNGFLEETYFTYTFSPIIAESDSPGGILCTVIETTPKIVADRRLKILNALNSAISGSKTIEEVCKKSCTTFDSSRADVKFAMFYLLDPDRKCASLVASSIDKLNKAELPPSKFAFDSPETLWPIVQVMRTGKLEITPLTKDINKASEEDVPHTAIVLPIKKPGTEKSFYGFLVAGLNPRRPVNERHISFFDLMAGHISNALASAEAYEQEQARAKALIEIDRAKTEFFSNISHEFRTPLTLILGPLEKILTSKTNTLTLDEKEEFSIVHRNALRLLKLVNTLLDFSQIESGRANAMYEKTNIGALTQDIVNSFRFAIENAGLKLTVHCDPVVAYVDYSMWEKIVMNLVSNALKYTLKGSISVKLTATSDQAILKVSDTGGGIEPADLPRIFERFFRGTTATSRSHEGTGIGLSFSRDLARLHGGDISVESEYQQGSTFTVTIPLGNSHLPKKDVQAEPISAIRDSRSRGTFVSDVSTWATKVAKPELGITQSPGKRDDKPNEKHAVLVVDDNDDMREFISSILSTEYEIVQCRDGEEAFDRILQAPPALVLSDIMMPRLDGVGLLKKIRSNPITEFIPVVFLSARAGEEAMVEGLEIGADDYLIKPFSERELRARVKTNVDLLRLRNLKVINKELVAIQADMSQFMHAAAHDLAEPTRRISVLLDLFLESNSDNLTEIQTKDLVKMRQQALNLDKLIREFRFLTRIDSGDLSKERIDTEKLIQSVLTELSAELQKKQVKLAFRGLTYFVGNPTMIFQLYRNLITNALKYGDEGMHLEFEQRADESGVTLLVANTGSSIDHSHLSELFVPFRRFSTRKEGTGIGLYICRRIVEVHGGHIECESSNGWTTFKISLGGSN